MASLSVLVVIRRYSDLASEDAQADRSVEQDEWEAEKPFTPDHEGKAGVRGRGVRDGDGERDHVRPERDRERPECRYENESHHDEGHTVLTMADACGEHNYGKRAEDGENEQVWPLEPSLHDRQIFRQGVGKHDNQKHEQCKRQIGDEAIGFVADLAFTFSDEPAGAEERVADTQSDAAEHRKGAEPTEFAANVATVAKR